MESDLRDLESCWVQAEGQPARQLLLASGDTVQALLRRLEGQELEFQLQNGGFAACSDNITLAALRAACCQDGQTEKRALHYRLFQVQGPPSPSFSAAKAKLAFTPEADRKPSSEASVVRAVRVFAE